MNQRKYQKRPLKGYRVWHVKPDFNSTRTYGKYRLFPIGGFQDAWIAGDNQAVCHSDTRHWHKKERKSESSYIPSIANRAPGKGCKCGFWMKATFNQAHIFSLDHGGIIGAVQAWGRCIKHPNGWRCEHMQVIALLDDSFYSYKITEQLSEYYEVPIFQDKDEFIRFVNDYN